MTRKLVSIRKIDSISPIEGADFIEMASVDGWTLVVKKGEFSVGDPCIYFEIDSFLPASDPRFAFLAKSGVKTDESGMERIRLKTMKLRGTISQGLALPLHQFEEVTGHEEEDLSDLLNVIKYERPEPKVANAAGNFPSYLRKTDEERIQNLWNKWKNKYSDVEFIPTLKLDGSSCTVSFLDLSMKDDWPVDGEDGVPKAVTINEAYKITVCSRNLMLKHDPDSHFWKAVYQSGIDDAIHRLYDIYGRPIAIQGEVMGPGIQGNPEGFNQYKFFAFNLFDIKDQRYLQFDEAVALFDEAEVDYVPILGEAIKPFQRFSGVDEILKFSDISSINAKIAEGIVWKSVGLDNPISFKSISNRFLLKVEN